MATFWNFGARRLGVISLCIVAVLVSWAILYVRLSSKPPKEKTVISNFYAHRTAYEQLRDMLQADKHVLRVASWGVETTESVTISIPPEGDFPVDRYNKYLALLKETGGVGAFRGRGEHPESVSIAVWASGWAGDTKHVHICWVEREPTNQVASLDDYYQTSKPRRPVFRHIEGNWYLWADW